MSETELTTDQVVAILVSEGHEPADVVAAIDSLINAGLELDQPEEGRAFTTGEVDVLRDQLTSA